MEAGTAEFLWRLGMGWWGGPVGAGENSGGAGRWVGEGASGWWWEKENAVVGDEGKENKGGCEGGAWEGGRAGALQEEERWLGIGGGRRWRIGQVV